MIENYDKNIKILVLNKNAKKVRPKSKYNRLFIKSTTYHYPFVPTDSILQACLSFVFPTSLTELLKIMKITQKEFLSQFLQECHSPNGAHYHLLANWFT
jgi:hypothetical protein